MTTEFIYHCDGPDCAMRVQSSAYAPVAGWLQVNEGVPSEPDNTFDFCSWDCLLKRAARVEPVQVIPWEAGPDGT
jgi:hypothetical protein